jgi:chromosome segregation ATPase
LNQKEIDIENNSNNHFQELNFLKNSIEEKNSEIKNLNEKMKNYMNQLNLLKGKNQELTKNNSQIKSEIE